MPFLMSSKNKHFVDNIFFKETSESWPDNVEVLLELLHEVNDKSLQSLLMRRTSCLRSDYPYTRT